MEIKVKNQNIILNIMKRYINAAGRGELAYPRCVICQKVEGEILGLYSKKGESSTTVYAVCRECWIENRSLGEKSLKETGKLDEVIEEKIKGIIEKLLADGLPNEIFQMTPEEWAN